ncbi:Glu/Leu/Phe/Val dehydrogenase dimerization domain-containing protein [Pseudonocardia xinjiangensis]|uniref:Glu/Leu/Phe/Val dehydrogenase dimerization domain-containing protein n=1 Tax=Pseudonocardia xinjiangensis TaxID=75289 RepID=UPI003D8E0CD9
MPENGALQHEDVVVRRGRRSGTAITVAVHSRVLGPAVGGCRIWTYPSWRDGAADAMRLAEAMTYKCAAAGLEYGGGKTVVALPMGTVLTPQLRRDVLHDVAEVVATFGGSYLVGPDVGTGPEDMMTIREVTPHSFCLPQEHGGTGNSGTPTAQGVQAALRAGARHVFGSESLSGRKVVIAGFGSVGSRLAAGLCQAGATVVVSDVDGEKQAAAESAGYSWVEPERALMTSADVLVPAAVGGVLNPRTVAGLDVPLVIGPANNQVTDDSVAGLLADAGTVWVPDFVTSAGGVIYVLNREVGGLDHDAAATRVEAIEDTVDQVLDAARTGGTTPLHESMVLAERRLRTAGAE